MNVNKTRMRLEPEGAEERCRYLDTMYCPRWDWVAVLVVQLCLVGCSADYFWDGTEWRWQVSAALQL